MMLAIVVDKRPSTWPVASTTNQRGSMSPCLGKYVRMTLPETASYFDLHLRRFPGARCEQPQREEFFKDNYTLSPSERGETVTPPNKACQEIHSRAPFVRWVT